MARKAKIRAMIVCCVMAACLQHRFLTGWSICRSIRARPFAALANQMQVLKQVLPAQRGSIRDIHGEILASDMPLRKVVADGRHT